MSGLSMDQHLASLYRMKREAREQLLAAEARGDLKRARTWQGKIRQVNNLILDAGGDVHAP